MVYFGTQLTFRRRCEASGSVVDLSTHTHVPFLGAFGGICVSECGSLCRFSLEQ